MSNLFMHEGAPSQGMLFSEKSVQAAIPPDHRPRVLNKHRDKIPAGAVYIGRPSRWGNPFEIGKDGDRDEVIAKYRIWLLAQPEMIRDARIALTGKNLVCYCSPKACHGDVLLEVANADQREATRMQSNAC